MLIYLCWKQDENDFKAEVQRDALEVLMKRHFIQMNSGVKQIDNYSTLNIVSDNLSRRCLCCFGHYQDVYFHNKLVEQKQGLSLMPLSHDMMMEQSERIRVQCERERRWNLLDADEWISFFQDVVKAMHSIGLVYFNEPFDCLFSLAELSQQSLFINNLTADTLLYLDPGVQLIVHDETMY